MAGIEFNREAFAPVSAPPERSIARMLSPILFLLAVGLVAVVGYKIYTETKQSIPVAAANSEVQQLQQQLAEMQKRLDQMEKHHKVAPADASPVSSDKLASSPSGVSSAKRTV